MDSYYKMCQATEEIERLNVEIPRFATYLRDEDIYLRTCEEHVRAFDKPLAHQIHIHRKERSRFTVNHLHCLHKISQLKGFSGSITPGESIEKGPGASAGTPNIQAPTEHNADRDEQMAGAGTSDIIDEDETAEDMEDDEAAEEAEEKETVLFDVLHVSGDS